ncbi:acyltransferase family protein [Ktedonosporobacter rubrisoli]|uniref:acyltransferase family protein n=1 Tax=Ktedonosporobacter rubrisoli TaxID=2509675 RepID=UPI0013EE4335|nr:acyltransferase [Ktedonosporobacter rubrisoli]
MFSLVKANTRKNTIVVLDGVRAVACLLVIFYHINLINLRLHVWQPAALGPFITALAVAGGSGVTLFFLLSGFLLFLPYARALLCGADWPSARQFYLRRALRIMPCYYLSLFLLILVQEPRYLQPAHLQELGLFLSFFMDSSRATFRVLDGPLWSLAIEWQFYLLLPWLALLFRWIIGKGTQRKRWCLLLVCLLLMEVWGIGTHYWGNYYLANPQQTVLVPRPLLNVILFFSYGIIGKFLEDFAIGMGIAACYVLAQQAGWDGLLAGLRRWSVWLWWAGLCVLGFMALWNCNQMFRHSIALLDPLYPAYEFYSEAGLSLGFGLCLLAILFGPASLQRPFRWVPLRWLGLISYSLYIWHLPLLVNFGDHIQAYIAGWNGYLSYCLFWLFAVLLIFPFAYTFYIWIEQPGIQLCDSLRKQKSGEKLA